MLNRDSALQELAVAVLASALPVDEEDAYKAAKYNQTRAANLEQERDAARAEVTRLHEHAEAMAIYTIVVLNGGLLTAFNHYVDAKLAEEAFRKYTGNNPFSVFSNVKELTPGKQLTFSEGKLWVHCFLREVST